MPISQRAKSNGGCGELLQLSCFVCGLGTLLCHSEVMASFQVTTDWRLKIEMVQLELLSPYILTVVIGRARDSLFDSEGFYVYLLMQARDNNTSRLGSACIATNAALRLRKYRARVAHLI